jgi:SAM-dependent methyltransferase
MGNINDSYFDGYYKDIWRSIIPDDLTVKEVEFMLSYFNLQPGNKVLDLMCGYGRHSIALAKKGMKVTAVDNLNDYINEVKLASEKDNLSITAEQADVANYEPTEMFDLVICMGNSLNFFNADDAIRLFRNISTHLNKGGNLLINSWSIAEIAIKNFKDKSWSTVGDKKFLVDCKYLFHPARIEFEHLILTPDGKTESKTGIDYIFSVNEIETMLNQTGFVLKELYSIPGKKKFILGEPRVYIVAEKK